jgi:glutathione-independent formaldehyde dehydrogenase
MKAVVFHGPYDVKVDDVEDARIEAPTDVIVRITSTCICGSDLHMYEGRTDAEPGLVFGHENQGIVEEVGEAVVRVKKGDRVNMPFNVGCGFCFNCERGLSGFCLTVNPGFAGGAYGYVNMGPYRGGQAEALRVPFADYNCLRLPEGEEHEQDFAMLSDIFPTGYHGAELADVRPGETVAVFGAGPVGLMSAYSCLIRGGAVVYVVDRVQSRLKQAEDMGCVPIDFSKGDAAEQILEMRGGDGVMKAIDAVGYQAIGSEGDDEEPNAVLEGIIKVTNPTGKVGCPGLYVPSDPGAQDPHAKQGMIPISFGKFFEKGLTIGTGQCNVKRYNRLLRDLIVAGRAVPSTVVTKELPLEEAPDAYERFDNREEGYTKVVLKPAA